MHLAEITDAELARAKKRWEAERAGRAILRQSALITCRNVSVSSLQAAKEGAHRGPLDTSGCSSPRVEIDLPVSFQI
jgi:hypothetical protein